MTQTPLSSQDQAKLARRAKRGDEEAAAELFRAAEPRLEKAASHYHRKYGGTIDAEDLIGAAQLKFAPSVLAFNGTGSFLNYFMGNAARAMIDAANKEAAKENVRGRKGPGLEDYDAISPEADHSEVAALDQAVQGLPPSERAIITALEGYGCKPQTPEVLAKALRLEAEHVHTLRAAIHERLKRAIETGRRSGRPPSSVTVRVALRARQLRSDGKRWKEIARLIEIEFGRKYTPLNLRVISWRKSVT